MPDDPNSTSPQSTPTPTPPTPNSLEARNPDGTIKDQQAQPSTQTPAKSSGTDSVAAAAGEQGTEGKDGQKPAAEAPVIPETYTFKAPEGFEIDQAVIDEATPILKELKIDQAGAEKLFDLFSKHTSAAQTEMVDFYENMRSDWRKEIATSTDVGNGKDGLSPQASQNIAAAIGSLPAELATAFKDAMNLTGAGDNPAFVRALAHFGAQFREGTFVRGGNPSPAGQVRPGAPQRSAASIVFPNLPSANSGS